MTHPPFSNASWNWISPLWQRVGRIDASLMAGAQNGHHGTLFEQTLFEVMHFNIGQRRVEPAQIAFNVPLMGLQTSNSLVHAKRPREQNFLISSCLINQF